MNTVSIIGLCAIPCIAGVGVFYRYRQISHLPFGTGCSVVSPDGRYRAYATQFVDVSFWGRTSWFYGFEVEECEASRTLAKHRTPRMARQETDEFCSEVRICWASDAPRVSVALRDRILWEYDLGHAAGIRRI